MSIKQDLASEMKDIFTAEHWQVQSTRGVPAPGDIGLGNFAKRLETATVLYADLDGSTKMVDEWRWWFAAEIYKAYLRCAARVIRARGGEITAYDGDRIMAIFVGDKQWEQAAWAALEINGGLRRIVQPALQARYPEAGYQIRHSVGVDTSELHAASIGVRGYNDIVWVGRAANYAAKLTSLNELPIWITDDVYTQLPSVWKRNNGEPTWAAWNWEGHAMTIWGSDSWSDLT